MINGRLTFDEFADQLLLHIALKSNADFDAVITAVAASELVPGTFHRSWIPQAVKYLEESGYIRTVDYDPDHGASLTIGGLREVESRFRLQGKDFWNELDELEANQRYALEASEPNDREEIEKITIVIDDMSDVFQAIENDIKETIRKVRSQNELMTSPAAAQRIAELEAGSALLTAPQADANLLTRLLIPALGWLLKKVGDEATKALIKRLIDDLPKWINSLL